MKLLQCCEWESPGAPWLQGTLLFTAASPFQGWKHTLCKHVDYAVRLQCGLRTAAPSSPLSTPCSPAESAACSCPPPCSPHPSHTVCCSFCHPPKLEGLPANASKAAWSITLAILFIFISTEEYPWIILPLLSKRNGAEQSTTCTLESLPLPKKETFTDIPDCPTGWFWATGRNLCLSVCAHHQDDTNFFCKPHWNAKICNNIKRAHVFF